MIVQWKSKNGNKEYRIFRGKLIVGILKKKGWSRSGYGEYNGALLQFIIKGFWNPVVTIFDIDGVKKLGQINYSLLKKVARIEYEDQIFEWAYQSDKKNTWSVVSGDDFVNYTVASTSRYEGTIDVEGIRPEVVLAGLYIHTLKQIF